MQNIASSYRGLGLLFEVNRDRLYYALVIAAALAAVAFFGAEYVQSFVVEYQAFGVATVV